MRHRRRRGFTLLEVLVATTIMAVAVSTLLAALATSLNNASRLTDSDRAAVLAKRTMDGLLASPVLLRGQVLQGQFDPRATGLEGGWRAMVEPFEKLEVGRMTEGIDRVKLEIWWTRGPHRRTFQLDGYRIAPPPGPPK